MSDIAYRPYRREDADDIKKILDEAFSIHRYATGRLVLDSALEIYLRDCLLSSTWTRVAVADGRVVGVIMGRVHGQPRLGGRLANRLLTIAHAVRAAVLGITQWDSMRQYFGFRRVYASLRKKAHCPLTDELTLFAVDSSTRGLGIGKTLYTDYLTHLRGLGRTDFFLYTDSHCTYGFYEKQGMTRAAEQDMDLTFDGTPETIGVYLYAGTTTEHAA